MSNLTDPHLVEHSLDTLVDTVSHKCGELHFHGVLRLVPLLLPCSGVHADSCFSVLLGDVLLIARAARQTYLQNQTFLYKVVPTKKPSPPFLEKGRVAKRIADPRARFATRATAREHCCVNNGGGTRSGG